MRTSRLRRSREDIPKIDAPPAERLSRALPFPGRFYSNVTERSYFQYGLELSEQGFDTPAVAAFEHVAKVDPSAITFYNLGTLYMKRSQQAQAKDAFERALQLKPDDPDANNSLGALLAESGQIPAAIERFRAALKARPAFADALNNLGFALFQTGDARQAYDLFQKALAGATRLSRGPEQPRYLLRPSRGPRSRADLFSTSGGQTR